MRKFATILIITLLIASSVAVHYATAEPDMEEYKIIGGISLSNPWYPLQWTWDHTVGLLLPDSWRFDKPYPSADLYFGVGLPLDEYWEVQWGFQLPLSVGTSLGDQFAQRLGLFATLKCDTKFSYPGVGDLGTFGWELKLTITPEAGNEKVELTGSAFMKIEELKLAEVKGKVDLNTGKLEYSTKLIDPKELFYGVQGTIKYGEKSLIGEISGNFTIDKEIPDFNACADFNSVVDPTNSSNMHMHACIAIYVQGDVNFDGIVDIMDLTICALAMWSHPGHPKWNPIADLNSDGLIDIVDLVIIGVNYGKTW